MITFFLEDSFDNIVKGVSLIMGKNLIPDRTIKRGDFYQQGIFDENYYPDELVTDEECKDILTKIPAEVLSDGYISFHRGDVNILRYIMLYIAHCLKKPQDAGNVTVDCVLVVRKSVKKVLSEVHRMKGFVRFEQLSDGSWYAPVAPRHNILPLIYKHFVNRFPEEKWVIHDTVRNSGACYDGHNIIFGGLRLELSPEKARQESEYQRIWKVFFEKIAVEGRKNPDLQKSKVPVFYRKNMPEFYK